MYTINHLTKQNSIKLIIGLVLSFLYPLQLFTQTGFSCIKLYQVTFSSKSGNRFDIRDDDDTQFYDKDHWQDDNLDGSATGPGEHKYPVCYKRGTKIAVEAKFKIDPAQSIPSGFKVKIKGACTSSAFNSDLPEKDATVSSSEIEYPETEATTALPNTVQFLDPLTITWSISFDDGKTWTTNGTSENRLYVIFNQPLGTARMFYTCVHIGCKNAVNQNDEKNVVDNIYTEFKDQSVRRVDEAVDMTYWSKVSPAPQPACWSTAGLLKYRDARCGGWADFFETVLGVQGIASLDIEIRSVSDYTVPPALVPRISKSVSDYLGPISDYSLGPNYIFYVKNWTIARPDTFAIDLMGAPGQGNSDPRAWFENHAVVKYNGKYYDPSYGQGSSPFGSSLLWEDANLDGFGALIIKKSTGDLFFWIDKKDPKGTLQTIFSN